MLTREKFLELLGDLAVTFAHLEILVSGIMALLIDEKVLLPGFIVASRQSTRWKLRRIRRLAGMPWHTQRRERVREFVNRVGKQLCLRNLFIHGVWTMDEADMSQDLVTVLDLDPSPAPEGKQWHTMRPEQYDYYELEARLAAVSELIGEALDIIHDLNPNVWAPAEGKAPAGGEAAD